MSKFLTFQEFETYEQATALADTLKEAGIPARIEQNRELLDHNLLGRQYNNYILLKVPAEHFEEAQRVLIDLTKVDLSLVDRNYMLFSLSNEELLEVMAKPDEWGAYNYNVAKAILEERGRATDEHKVATLHEEHLSKLRERRKLPFHWMLIGYGVSAASIAACVLNASYTLFILFRFYLLPGILGLILGLIVRLTKRTLPNGTQIYSYDDAARKHGLAMIIAGAVSLLLVILRGYFINNPRSI